jgi:hypothetical protein
LFVCFFTMNSICFITRKGLHITRLLNGEEKEQQRLIMQI